MQRVRVRAGRNIDGDDRRLARIQKFNRVRIETSHRRLESRAENCVEIEISRWRTAHALEFLTRSNDDRFHRQPAIHCCGVAFQLRRISQQNHLHRFGFFTQDSRCDKPIAAVVPLAAKDNNLFGAPIRSQHMLGNSRASVLHQRERSHAKALAGDAIDGAHFCCGNDFHKSVVGRSSLVVGQNSSVSPTTEDRRPKSDYKTKRPSTPCGGPQNESPIMLPAVYPPPAPAPGYASDCRRSTQPAQSPASRSDESSSTFPAWPSCIHS